MSFSEAMSSRAAKLIASTSRVRCRQSWRLAVALTLVSSAAFPQAQDEAGDTAPAPAPPGAASGAPPAPAPGAGAYGPMFLPAPGTNIDSHLPSSSQSKSDIY